jgi:hypothetical protein
MGQAMRRGGPLFINAGITGLDIGEENSNVR